MFAVACFTIKVYFLNFVLIQDHCNCQSKGRNRCRIRGRGHIPRSYSYVYISHFRGRRLHRVIVLFDVVIFDDVGSFLPPILFPPRHRWTCHRTHVIHRKSINSLTRFSEKSELKSEEFCFRLRDLFVDKADVMVSSVSSM